MTKKTHLSEIKIPISESLFKHLICPLYAQVIFDYRGVVPQSVCAYRVKMLGRFYHECPLWYEKNQCWKLLEHYEKEMYETIMQGSK